MKKILILLATLAIVFGATAGQRDFAKLDKDQDGKLSKEEFLQRIKTEKIDQMTQVFVNRDKNKDGYLVVDEYTIKSKNK